MFFFFFSNNKIKAIAEDCNIFSAESRYSAATGGAARCSSQDAAPALLTAPVAVRFLHAKF